MKCLHRQCIFIFICNFVAKDVLSKSELYMFNAKFESVQRYCVKCEKKKLSVDIFTMQKLCILSERLSGTLSFQLIKTVPQRTI